MLKAPHLLVSLIPALFRLSTVQLLKQVAGWSTEFANRKELNEPSSRHSAESFVSWHVH